MGESTRRGGLLSPGRLDYLGALQHARLATPPNLPYNIYKIFWMPYYMFLFLGCLCVEIM